MSRLYLIRHGLANANHEKRYLGHLDEPISEVGRRQAEALRQRFASEEIRRVYASGLKRAMETARPIATPHGLEPTPIEELGEINFGEWEGMTARQIEERWPGDLRAWFTEPRTHAIPGGESWEHFDERVRRGFARVSEELEGAGVLVVHGGVLRAIFGILLGLDGPLTRVNFDHASVSAVDIYGEAPVVQYINDLCHLPEDLRGT